MLIDLHTHSSVSDGTETPAEVMVQAARAGLDVVALTDHDTVLGWDEAADAAAEVGIGLVRGLEISCSLAGRSVHLLGYLISPDDDDLMQELAEARESRLTRIDRMVELLAEDGIPITIDQVRAEVADPGTTVGRPHLADALVTAGLVRDRAEAFSRYLHTESPYYVQHYSPDPLRAVELVVAAGGVAVLAHPYSRRQHDAVTPDLIADLAAVGLAGIEVDHRDHTVSDRAALRGVATELGLLVTGSSDYHGDGKPNRLGEYVTEPAVFEAIVARASGSAYLPA